jgi:beta-1,4-mannosyl-glycoprotein beta-1,4-N-acetylglucosaminyltransferase
MTKVYDCITFGGELDMLEGRLNTYADVVDKFVIVEGDHMYANQPKPFYFEENYERFKDFEDKIIYHKVQSQKSSNAWDNDYYQRARLSGVLASLNPSIEDLVLICDTDEWVDFDKIKDITGPVGLTMPKYHMSLHWYHKNEPTAVVARYGDVAGKDLDRVRWQRNYMPQVFGGWHLTSMGDLQYLIRKVRGFAHQELVTEYVDEALEHCWVYGHDLAGDIYTEIELEQANYPQWVRDRKFPEEWYRRRPEFNLTFD